MRKVLIALLFIPFVLNAQHRMQGNFNYVALDTGIIFKRTTDDPVWRIRLMNDTLYVNNEKAYIAGGAGSSNWYTSSGTLLPVDTTKDAGVPKWHYIKVGDAFITNYLNYSDLRLSNNVKTDGYVLSGSTVKATTVPFVSLTSDTVMWWNPTSKEFSRKRVVTGITQLAQGWGIVATPNPIVSTGNVKADSTVLQTKVLTTSQLFTKVNKADSNTITTGKYATPYWVNNTYVKKSDSATGVKYATKYDLRLYRKLNNHDSLSTLDEKSYNSLTDKPTIPTQYWATFGGDLYPINQESLLIEGRRNIFGYDGGVWNSDYVTLALNGRLQLRMDSLDTHVGTPSYVIVPDGVGRLEKYAYPAPMTYPSAGIAYSNGTSWATSLDSTKSAFRDRYNIFTKRNDFSGEVRLNSKVSSTSDSLLVRDGNVVKYKKVTIPDIADTSMWEVLNTVYDYPQKNIRSLIVPKGHYQADSYPTIRGYNSRIFGTLAIHDSLGFGNAPDGLYPNYYITKYYDSDGDGLMVNGGSLFSTHMFVKNNLKVYGYINLVGNWGFSSSDTMIVRDANRLKYIKTKTAVQSQKYDSIHWGTTGTYVSVDTTNGIRLYGNATCWDDYDLIITTGQSAGSSYPLLSDTSNLYRFVVDTTGVTKCIFYGNQEMSHSWKIGSDLHPHVHFRYTSTAGTPTFVLKYRWVNIGDVPGAWTWIRLSTTTGTTNNSIQMSYNNAQTISGTGKTLSSTLQFQLYLQSQTGTGGIDVQMLGIHYQIDSFGSKDELVK